MRASLIRSVTLSLLLAAALGACSTRGEIPPSKHVSQSGALKVHPGLLGQPVPPELQGPQTTAVAAAKPVEETPIRMDEEGLRTQRSVYFDLDKSDLKSDYAPILQAHARYLAKHPEARVRIEGHADERGSADYNQRLGLRRAQSVRATLVGHGADGKQVTVKTYGKAKPKLLGHNDEAWAENRRADVIYEREK